MSKKRIHLTLQLLMLGALLINGKTIAQRGPSSNIIPNSMKPEVVIEQEKLEKEQKRIPTKIGFGLETYVTGNAHGAFYAAGVNVSKGKALFSIAPCLQKRSKELNGGKIGFSYLISGINDRYDQDEINEMKDDPHDILELRVSCSVHYIHQANLSYKAARVETITSNTPAENRVNFNDLRISTIEAALCAEIDINIKWFKIRSYMGCTGFYHLNYLDGMYRPRIGPALIFGTGIVIPSL